MGFTQDPTDLLDYPVDWSRWLKKKTGDTIASSEWIDITPGITTSNEGFTDTATVIWITGGVVGERYYLTNRIVTAGGREKKECISVVIRENCS